MSNQLSQPLNCFTAYDIRGKIPTDLNEEIAKRIALAYTDQCHLCKVVVGQDMRLSSPAIATALIDTLSRQGVDVINIGLCGTEEVYFHVFNGEKDGVDGGVMVTASHNPADYNGMKLVQRGARPVSSASGLREIANKAASLSWYEKTCAKKAAKPGKIEEKRDKQLYIEHLLSYVDIETFKPMRIVANAGNGCAGPVIDLLEEMLPFSFVKLNHSPDGTFPNGVPNPLLPEKRESTAQAVRETGADLGLAWDGDFDRCFFFDGQGRFIEGYYIVGLLAEAILQKNPGATILHDPRLIWNTQELVVKSGGRPVLTRTGHAFIKEKMRQEDAVYGGEMSAHHYFRDFGYCDSGMIPWLLICALISQTGRSLAEMVDTSMHAFPVSGEINSKVRDPDALLAELQKKYADGDQDFTDGLSVTYSNFRFNVRKSNTEPVIRLNVETRGNTELLQQKTDELLALIRSE